MKTAIVTKEHRSNYPAPLKIARGTVVTVEKRESEWDGWLWCITENNQGWIPDSYVEVCGERAEFIRDYDATELNVAVGEKLTLFYKVNGWHWCQNESGHSGWVPADCFGNR